MEEITINKCSLCGGEAEVVSVHIKGISNGTHYFIKCIECGHRQVNDYKILSTATQCWNHRETGYDRGSDYIKDLIETIDTLTTYIVNLDIDSDICMKSTRCRVMELTIEMPSEKVKELIDEACKECIVSVLCGKKL